MRFQTVCETMDAIGNTRSSLEKLNLAAKLLQNATSEDELKAITLFLLGRIFPEHATKKLNVGYKLLWQVVMELSQHPEKETREYYRKDSDIGRTVEFAIRAKKATLFSFMEETPEPKIYDVLAVHDFFSKLATVTGVGAQKKRARMLKEIIREVTPREAKYLARIILEETRVGFRASFLQNRDF